jgi:hypothetical protein
MSLAEFLLARIAEDEADWLKLRDGIREEIGNRVIFPDRPGGSVTIVPAKMLVECEAKRRIVEQYERAFVNRKTHPDDLASAGALLALHGVVHLLALPSADHPDYKPEWRV